MFCAFFNDLPLWKVPDLFSWQHVVLMLIAAFYVVMFSLLLKKRKEKTQERVFKILSLACAIIFCGRFIWGYHSLIYTPIEERVGFWFNTLVPLELCNLGIFILIITAFSKKRFWYMISFYITLLGGITALIAFPFSHRWPESTILNFQFFDYYFIHAHLVALPIAFVVTGKYRPQYKDVWKAVVAIAVITFSIYLICVSLNAIFQTNSVNYMWVMGDEEIPLLKDLWRMIHIPFLYMLPLFPLILLLFIGVTFIATLPKRRKD